MKLSVIIPVYNGAFFIEKSYNSITDQDIDDFEIIYVDNNSKDASIAEINKITNRDLRVRLLFQTKQGAAAARNLGIQNASGDYIYVFDVDDEIYPNALKRMIAVLDSSQNVDAVFGKMVKSTKSISETKKPMDETFAVSINATPYWGLAWFSNLKLVVGPPAFLYKKRVFDTIGYYNESIRNGEDTAFDIKLGMTSTVAFLDIYVYLYFKHDGSTIQTSKRHMPRAFMAWPRLVKEHLPFYLANDVPARFEYLLLAQIFQSMGRQVQFTKGLWNRYQLKNSLFNELSTVKIPFLIRIYLVVLVVFPFKFMRKIYGYNLVPYAVRQLLHKKLTKEDKAI